MRDMVLESAIEVRRSCICMCGVEMSGDLLMEREREGFKWRGRFLEHFCDDMMFIGIWNLMQG